MSPACASWAWVLAAIAAVAVAWFLPAAIGRYYTQMLALAGIYAIVAQGLNLLAGYTGQASLGHAGFYAIGAYTGALLATKLGFGFWSALPFSIVVAAAAGVLIALPSFKLDGPYLAMVTIAFGIIVNSVLIEWSDLTGGTQGVLNIPTPDVRGQRLSLESQFLLIVCSRSLSDPVAAQPDALAMGARFRGGAGKPDRGAGSGPQHARGQNSRLHDQRRRWRAPAGICSPSSRASSAPKHSSSRPRSSF